MIRFSACLAALCIGLVPPVSAADWIVTDVNGIPAEGAAMLGFSPTGDLFGNTGCNGFQGRGRFEEGALVLDGPLAMTRRACLGDRMMAQENALVALLQGRIALRFDPFSDTLVLSDGKTSATLVPMVAGPREQDAPSAD